MTRSLSLLVAGLVLCLAAREALAQDCSPPCRQGFACVAGTCVAACNPPCPPGTVCVDGLTCESTVTSQCNPPCPAGTVCVDGLRCDPVAAQCNPPCREGHTCVDGRCVVAPASPAASPQPPAGSTAPGPAAGDAAAAEDEPLGTLLKLMLGLGGTVSSEVDGESGDDHDLITTFGAGVEVDFPFLRGRLSAGVGLLGAVLFWNSEEADDADFGRSIIVDIDAVPKVSYRVMPRLFAYAGLPLGLCIGIPNSDANPDAEVGFGFNIGFLLGAQYAMESFGFFAELGYHWHNFTNTVSNEFAGDIDVTTSLSQFMLNLGLAF